MTTVDGCSSDSCSSRARNRHLVTRFHATGIPSEQSLTPFGVCRGKGAARRASPNWSTRCFVRFPSLCLSLLRCQGCGGRGCSLRPVEQAPGSHGCEPVSLLGDRPKFRRSVFGRWRLRRSGGESPGPTSRDWRAGVTRVPVEGGGALPSGNEGHWDQFPRTPNALTILSLELLSYPILSSPAPLPAPLPAEVRMPRPGLRS